MFLILILILMGVILAPIFFKFKKQINVVLAIFIIVLYTTQVNFTSTDYLFIFNQLQKLNYIPSLKIENLSKFVTQKQMIDSLYNIDMHDENIAQFVLDNSVLVYSNNTRYSGTVIADNIILTCAHGIKDENEKIKIGIYGGYLIYAKVEKINYSYDLCLLKTETPIHPTKKINFTHAKLGEKVYSVGSPADFPFSFNEGFVSNANRLLSGDRIFLQLNMVTMGGDSGSGVFNRHGELISIRTNVYSNDSQISFGVISDRLIEFTGSVK